VILSATSGERLDGLCMQGVAYRFAVESAVREEDIRRAPWFATLPGHFGKASDSRKYLSVIAGIWWCGVDDDRDSAPVHGDSVLRTQAPAVNRAWPSGVAAAEMHES